MKLRGRVFLAMAYALACATMAAAQGAIGSESNTITDSRMPTVMTIKVDNIDITKFPVDIPFTLSGSPATVYLAVYTNLKDLPGYSVEGNLNSHIYQDVNYAVYVSPGSRFEAGSHTIKWDGKDKNGKALSPTASYRFYIIGIDDRAPVNMVGYTDARHYSESCFAKDKDGNLYTVTSGTTVRLTTDGPRQVILSKVGTNWKVTPSAWQAIEAEDLYTTPYIGDVVPAQWSGAGSGKQYGVLPGDFYGASSGGDPLVVGGIKFHVDPAAGRVTLDKNFGTEGDGELKVEPFSAIPGVSYGVDYWKGKLYYTGYNPSNPAYSAVAVMDAKAPFEMIDLLDLSEWHVIDIGNGNEAYSSWDSWVDDTGIWVLGYAASAHVKLSLDGELLWVNDNGDGFADRVDPTTGEYHYGGFQVTPWNVSNSSDKSGFGFALIPLLGSTTSTVDILGPDGTGILHFVGDNAPAHWPQWTETIEEDGLYDGLYYDIGSRRGGGTDAWDVPDFTGFPARQAIHVPFDLKSAYINPGAGPVTVVEEVERASLPKSYKLENAAPNPANPQTTIQFSLPQGEYVNLRIYNIMGQLVKTLHEGWVEAGTYKSVWDGTDESGRSMASGVYLYRMEAGIFSEAKKVSLLK